MYAVLSATVVLGMIVALCVSRDLRRVVTYACCWHEDHLKTDAASGRVWEECWKCGRLRDGWRVSVNEKFPVTKPLVIRRTRRRKPGVERVTKISSRR